MSECKECGLPVESGPNHISCSCTPQPEGDKVKTPTIFNFQEEQGKGSMNVSAKTRQMVKRLQDAQNNTENSTLVFGPSKFPKDTPAPAEGPSQGVYDRLAAAEAKLSALRDAVEVVVSEYNIHENTVQLNLYFDWMKVLLLEKALKESE